jgi:hypothetical protein
MTARKTLAEALLKRAWIGDVNGCGGVAQRHSHRLMRPTALAQLMADAVLQTIAVYLARHDSR